MADPCPHGVDVKAGHRCFPCEGAAWREDGQGWRAPSAAPPPATPEPDCAECDHPALAHYTLHRGGCIGRPGGPCGPDCSDPCGIEGCSCRTYIPGGAAPVLPPPRYQGTPYSTLCVRCGKAPGSHTGPEAYCPAPSAPVLPDATPTDPCPRGGLHTWAREVFDANDDTRSTGRMKCLRCGEWRPLPDVEAFVATPSPSSPAPAPATDLRVITGDRVDQGCYIAEDGAGEKMCRRPTWVCLSHWEESERARVRLTNRLGEVEPELTRRAAQVERVEALWRLWRAVLGQTAMHHVERERLERCAVELYRALVPLNSAPASPPLRAPAPGDDASREALDAIFAPYPEVPGLKSRVVNFVANRERVHREELEAATRRVEIAEEGHSNSIRLWGDQRKRLEAAERERDEARAERDRLREQRDNAWKDLEHVGNVLGGKIKAGQDFAHAVARVMNLGSEKLDEARAERDRLVFGLRQIEIRALAGCAPVESGAALTWIAKAASVALAPRSSPAPTPENKEK